MIRRTLILLAFTVRAAAAQGGWVVVEQRVVLDGARTADDVKRDALYGALAEAVRRVAGVQVQSGELATRGDSGGHPTDRYVQSVRLDAAGRAIEWHVMHDEWTKATKSSAPPTYHLTLRVLVARDAGTADPSFLVHIGMNRSTLQVRGDTPAANDELIVALTSTQRGFVTLAAILDDSVFVLAPNAVVAEVPIAAGTALELPGAGDREAGLHFRAMLPVGAPVRAELLAAVITKSRVPLRGSMTLAEFNRWLSGIPLDQRAIAQTAIAIQRRP